MSEAAFDWSIRPLVGVGELRLGMTAKEVAKIIGNNIKFTRDLEDGSYNEIRHGGIFPVCNYSEDLLRCIDIYSVTADVRIGSIMIFSDKPQEVVRKFEEMNGAPSISFGICFFKKIGISLGKWINPQTLEVKKKPPIEQDLRSISVCKLGLHDDIFPESNVTSLISRF